MKKLSGDALKERRRYQNEWRKRNKDRVRGYNITYWENKASRKKDEEDRK